MKIKKGDKLPDAKVFILENVKGLTTIKGGKYHQKIMNHLRKIGKRGEIHSEAEGEYEMYEEILDTKHYGIPQSRPRWYCVRFRKEILEAKGKSFVFPRNK